MKKALITGVTGQDGSYLADILLERGYEVHGLYRRVSQGNFKNIDHIIKAEPVEFHLHKGDITDASSVLRVIREVQPDELYHMADQDNVGWSYETPWLSSELTAKSVGTVLELVRTYCRDCRVFIPCSATMFGAAEFPQTELTQFAPQSPYAVAKVAAYYWAQYYRETHKLHVVTGIMYNHDSPRRQGDYLLHKICRGVVNGEAIELGDPSQRVDIGDAKEYMEVVHEMMQLPLPDFYVLGTGEAPTIGDVVNFVRAHSLGGNLSVRWGHPDRPGAPPALSPDTTKLQRALGWVKTTRNVYNVVAGLLAHYRSSP